MRDDLFCWNTNFVIPMNLYAKFIVLQVCFS